MASADVFSMMYSGMGVGPWPPRTNHAPFLFAFMTLQSLSMFLLKLGAMKPMQMRSKLFSERYSESSSSV